MSKRGERAWYTQRLSCRLAWLRSGWSFGSKGNLHILGRILPSNGPLFQTDKSKNWFSHRNNPIMNTVPHATLFFHKNDY